jgi:uncharacterized membrane protein
VKQQTLPDGGPRYYETDLDQFIVEPWNMASAILFIFLTIYWLLRLRGQYADQRYLTAATLGLGVGAVGGTIYHGFRIDAFYMYMDWMPILILCMATAVYFLFRLYGGWKKALFVMALITAVQVAVLQFFPPPYATNVSYALLAMYILLPTFLMLRKTKFRNWHLVVSALLSFVVALSCRIFDKWGLLPMGTHFLWHTFGAIATHLMFLFVYRLNTVQKRKVMTTKTMSE